jgi:hypothetical protein
VLSYCADKPDRQVSLSTAGNFSWKTVRVSSTHSLDGQCAPPNWAGMLRRCLDPTGTDHWTNLVQACCGALPVAG